MESKIVVKSKEVIESIDTGLLFFDQDTDFRINSISHNVSSRSILLDESFHTSLTVFDDELGNIEINITANKPYHIQKLSYLTEKLMQLTKG